MEKTREIYETDNTVQFAAEWMNSKSSRHTWTDYHHVPYHCRRSHNRKKGRSSSRCGKALADWLCPLQFSISIGTIRTVSSVQFSSVQSLSRVRFFVTPWIAARQASLSITNSRSSLRLTSIDSVMSSSHLILGRPLLLLPPIPPSIRVFSNESTLHMRWPK